MNTEQQISRWGRIVTKAWQDEGFKKRLLADPAAVLREQGLAPVTGVQIRVVEDSDKVLHLTLPAKPRDGELSDADLAGVAGGIVALVKTLASVFGWSPKQVDQILGRGDVPYTGGGGDSGSSGDDGRE